jgi:hypothetical protein
LVPFATQQRLALIAAAFSGISVIQFAVASLTEIIAPVLGDDLSNSKGALRARYRYILFETRSPHLIKARGF